MRGSQAPEHEHSSSFAATRKTGQEWAAEDLIAILNDTGTYKAPWIH